MLTYTRLWRLGLAMILFAPAAAAQDRLCDPAFEDCRAPLVNLIRNETVGIDVAFFFMQDQMWATELINRHNAGVPVRLIVDPRGDREHPGNQAVLDMLRAAGLPMRYKLGSGNMHMKMMLFDGQGTVQFSAANYSPNYFIANVPYRDYIDEAIYFCEDPVVVNSFRAKYDELWVNTSRYGNYANVSGPLTRRYPAYAIDPSLNFPPGQDFILRSVSLFNAEAQKIDVIIYRINDQRLPDALINARNRGVPVRLMTEPNNYRSTSHLWHSWNVDRMYMAGVQIKHRKHVDINHQKSTILYGQGMTIFGSSNWTTASANSQQEHNYFTNKGWIFDWFVNQFNRKWDSAAEYEPFVPLPPAAPKSPSPANAATAQPTAITLRWEGGYWAHKYDIYFGTSSNPALIASDVATGAPGTGTAETYALPPLSPATTYYWRVVGKTMANKTANGPTWSFTTGGSAPPPAPPPAPTGLTATGVSAAQINLTWSDVTGESGYRIERSLSATSGWVEVGTKAADSTTHQDTGLTAGTTYYYRVRAYNANGNSPYSNTASAQTLQPPPPSSGTVVLYASEATVKAGGWVIMSDATAAGGALLRHPNAGAAKLSAPLATPAHYFEMSFDAEAGRAYRLWIRGKADLNHWANDSVFVQFSGSVDAGGAAVYRIGTTGATSVNLEDCSGCGVAGWGWQDNGYGAGVLGPVIYFQTTGRHTIRVQTREDGLSIDQIVLSPQTYLNSSPGALRNDTTVLPRS